MMPDDFTERIGLDDSIIERAMKSLHPLARGKDSIPWQEAECALTAAGVPELLERVAELERGDVAGEQADDRETMEQAILRLDAEQNWGIEKARDGTALTYRTGVRDGWHAALAARPLPERKDRCGAVYDPPTAGVRAASNTYSPPTACELPVDHDDPLHRSGEVTWETVEYALGRSDPEGLLGSGKRPLPDTETCTCDCDESYMSRAGNIECCVLCDKPVPAS